MTLATKDCPFCYAYAEFGDTHDSRCPEVMASWSVETWGQFVDAINNGLGWAESEGMAHDFGSRPSTVAAVLLLVAAYRRAESKP